MNTAKIVHVEEHKTASGRVDMTFIVLRSCEDGCDGLACYLCDGKGEYQSELTAEELSEAEVLALKPRHLEYALNERFEEIEDGRLIAARTSPCFACDGDGRIINEELDGSGYRHFATVDCRYCDGKGESFLEPRGLAKCGQDDDKSEVTISEVGNDAVGF